MQRAARNILVEGVFKRTRADQLGLVFNGMVTGNNNNNAAAMDIVSCGTTTRLSPTGPMSYEIVFRPYQVFSSMILFAQWDFGSNSGRFAVGNASGGLASQVFVQFANAAGTDAIAGSYFGSLGAFQRWTTTHLIVVIDPTQGVQANRLRVYTNGAAETLTIGGAGVPASFVSPCTSQLRYGAFFGRATANGLPFFGSVGLPKIWNRALSANEAAARYREATYPLETYSETAAIQLANVDPRDLVDAIDFDGGLTSAYQVAIPVATPAAPRGPQYVPLYPDWTLNPNADAGARIGDSLEAGSQWDQLDTGNPKVGRRQGFMARLHAVYNRQVRWGGSRSDGGAALPGWSGYVTTHDGVPGERLDQINTRIPAILAAVQPRWITLNGVVNDIGQGASPATALTRLQTCINSVYQTINGGTGQPWFDPRWPLLVSDGSPYPPSQANIDTYNAGFLAVIQTSQNNGWNVIPVRVSAVLSSADQPTDQTHFFQEGYEKWGNLEADALAPFLY